jgi:hypothetical protein
MDVVRAGQGLDAIPGDLLEEDNEVKLLDLHVGHACLELARVWDRLVTHSLSLCHLC